MQIFLRVEASVRSGPSSDEAATQGIYDLATWQCGHVLGIMPPKQSSKVVIEPIPLTATTVDIVRLLHPLQVESVSITVQGGKARQRLSCPVRMMPEMHAEYRLV